MSGYTPTEKAYLAPFVAFLGFLFLGELVAKFGEGFAFWMFAQPRYWIYPLQTIVCGALLVRYRKHYPLSPLSGGVFATAVGVAVFAIWISPQLLHLATPRTDGFLPHFFGNGGATYATQLALRFIRLVVVVPLVEEIFWRGFLLRYLIRHDFTSVPFGTFDWKSFAGVTAGFCLEHQFADWPAAILAGALYNLVAYRTRSLPACILAHAVTNLLLGIWVLRTGQWGFW